MVALLAIPAFVQWQQALGCITVLLRGLQLLGLWKGAELDFSAVDISGCIILWRVCRELFCAMKDV